MWVRPFGRSGVSVPIGTEAAAFDRWSIQEVGVPEPVLMENAGRSAAILVNHLFPHSPVVALVGSGNNGGDAIVAARNLIAWGRSVHVIYVGERNLPDPLLHGWEGPAISVSDTETLEEAEAVLGSAGVVVDGLLGTGLSGPPRDLYGALIEAVNSVRAPTVSLDIPSGVDGDAGRVPGVAVHADLTIAFGWPKLGTMLHPGRAHSGRLVAVEIGFPVPDPERAFPLELITPGWTTAHRPVRKLQTHKNEVGSLTLVAGGRGMAGAAVMAARSALRSGVGLLRVISHPDNREILQESVPEAVWIGPGDPERLGEAVASSDALAVGPGLGLADESARLLSTVLDASPDQPVVLDADALNLVAIGASPSLDRLADARPLLVTPHPGEMARLTGVDTTEVTRGPIESARKLAASTGAAVLLKGRPSIVVDPDGRGWIDTVGTSDLASGGMGDVLTGTVGSLLAQGLSPSIAGALALHWTGRAAVLGGQGAGLLPEDVIRCLPEALLEEGPGDTDLHFPFVTFDQDPPR